MYRMKYVAFLMGLALLGLVPSHSEGNAAAYRQYYSGWSYYPSRSYYYRTYYYKPYATYPDYKYHYCVYYPTTPNYVYYYNPVSNQYWGRYDLKAKGYSMLEAKDRKANVKDIPESAFPKPGKMPSIPDSEDAVAMDAPPPDLPKEPKDLPPK
ncbi:MAG: hypothetical protein ACK4RK_17875 [Gemmataceae bacterium]